jgi:hypothetical protein
MISITIVLLIVGGIVSTYIYKSKTVDKGISPVISDEEHVDTDKSTDEVDFNENLTFSVLGDVHGNITNLEEVIKDLYTINPHMDALVLNGDTVDQGKEEQYDSIKNVISENKDLLPKTIIKNIGNHEFYNYQAGTNSSDQVQNFIDRYLEFSGEEKVYHDIWLKDYHFISLGSEDGNSKTLDSVRAFISENQQKWLKEKLAEKYQRGKPIFVFLHQHLNFENKGWIGVEQSKEVIDILSKYPEVILFTSHTHSDLDDSSVILNQPFTMIHTGSVSYTIIPDQNSADGKRREAYIKGLYIEVNGNQVIVKGRDIKEKQWIFTKEISK